MLQDPWVMVAEKGNDRSGLAMSALVRALARKNQVAVILFVPRVSETGGANAAICVGYPLWVRAPSMIMQGHAVVFSISNFQLLVKLGLSRVC